MKQQSELLRDLTEPGWRELNAARALKLMQSIPVRSRRPGDITGRSGLLPEDGWDEAPNP